MRAFQLWRTGAFLLLSFGVASWQSAQAMQQAAHRPNVLFIAVDDLNDWVHPLGGYPHVQTPNLDRLAARGMLFTRAYCSAPACNPSRASLLTGIMPSTSGVYHNSQPWRPVMPDVVTLPQHFIKQGYHVVGCGKIYHGTYEDAASWQDYFKKGGDPVPTTRPANGVEGVTENFDWGPLDVADAEMNDAKVTAWAIDYLKRERDKPFFLAAGIFRPHLPWYVPRKYFDRYPLDEIILPQVKDDDLDDVPPIGREMANPKHDHEKVVASGKWKEGVQGYLASITFADSCIGRLLDALDSSGKADNTVIVLWGDHGWHLGEKLHWRKFTLWEEATRVPFIIVAPGVAKPGSRCERTVSLIDIYPTLADLCGSKPPSAVQGRSLVPLLQDSSTPWKYPAITTHGRNNHAVRSERWRYIRYSDGSEELYDHDNDPMEWTNLASKAQNEAIKEELAAWLPKINADDAPHNSGVKKGTKGDRMDKD